MTYFGCLLLLQFTFEVEGATCRCSNSLVHISTIHSPATPVTSAVKARSGSESSDPLSTHAPPLPCIRFLPYTHRYGYHSTRQHLFCFNTNFNYPARLNMLAVHAKSSVSSSGKHEVIGPFSQVAEKRDYKRLDHMCSVASHPAEGRG